MNNPSIWFLNIFGFWGKIFQNPFILKRTRLDAQMCRVPLTCVWLYSCTYKSLPAASLAVNNNNNIESSWWGVVVGGGYHCKNVVKPQTLLNWAVGWVWVLTISATWLSTLGWRRHPGTRIQSFINSSRAASLIELYLLLLYHSSAGPSWLNIRTFWTEKS